MNRGHRWWYCIVRSLVGSSGGGIGSERIGSMAHGLGLAEWVWEGHIHYSGGGGHGMGLGLINTNVEH